MMTAAKNLYDYTIGGYPEEFFINLKDDEKRVLECSICYLVSRDPRECASGHIFCTSCIVAWATGDADGSGKCPVCRVPGRYYRPSAQAHYVVSRQMVRCPELKCHWVGILREYKYHKKLHASHSNSSIEGLVPIQLFLKSMIKTRKSYGYEDGDLGGDENLILNSGDFMPGARSDIRHHNNDEANNHLVRNGADSSSSSRPKAQSNRLVANNLRDMPAAPRSVSIRETAAKESLKEVETIRHQLSKVSTDLSLLLVRMNKDQARYMGYINSRPRLSSLPDYTQLQSDDARVLRDHLHLPNRASMTCRHSLGAGNRSQRTQEPIKEKKKRCGGGKSISPSVLSKDPLVQRLYKEEKLRRK